MTTGELAKMFNAELRLGLKLTVVRMEGWRRSDFFDSTGLSWINPSPNMRSVTQALLYPGIGLLESTNLSVGRGTDTPFEVIGAPWLDARRLDRKLSQSSLPGVRFVPIVFTPESSKFRGELCQGLNIVIVDHNRFQPVHTGLEIAYQLQKLYPDRWQADKMDRLLASAQTLSALLSGKPVTEIESLWEKELAEFRGRREKFLLYK